MSFVFSFDNWLNSEHQNGFKYQLTNEIRRSNLNNEVATSRDAVTIVDTERYPPNYPNKKVYLGFFNKIGNEMKGSFWGVRNDSLQVLDSSNFEENLRIVPGMVLVQFIYTTQSTMEMVCFCLFTESSKGQYFFVSVAVYQQTEDLCSY